MNFHEPQKANPWLEGKTATWFIQHLPQLSWSLSSFSPATGTLTGKARCWQPNSNRWQKARVQNLKWKQFHWKIKLQRVNRRRKMLRTNLAPLSWHSKRPEPGLCWERACAPPAPEGAQNRALPTHGTRTASLRVDCCSLDLKVRSDGYKQRQVRNLTGCVRVASYNVLHATSSSSSFNSDHLFFFMIILTLVTHFSPNRVTDGH